jgi:sensor histidine kinase YesM
MDIDVERAKIMIADLAELLRRVLDQKDVQIVPLSNELDLLEKYVNIEKTRFSDDLSVYWDIDESLLSKQVPSMILQPLVENAIRHGFSKKHLELSIIIRAYAQDGHLCLSVCDNGQGLKHAAGKDIFQRGMGLQNTRERLQSIYGDTFQFSVRDTQEGTCSLITLPLAYGAAELAYPAAVIPVNQLSDV